MRRQPYRLSRKPRRPLAIPRRTKTRISSCSAAARPRSASPRRPAKARSAARTCSCARCCKVAELLEAVPGMIAAQHSGSGKANQYFLRGFNLDHGTDFTTYIDGVQMNFRTHGHGQGYLDLNGLIPEIVDREDYRKGPYRADGGDFALAGAAYMSTVDQLEQLPTVWPRPFSGRGQPGRSSISPSRIPRARDSITRPICWRRWAIHAVSLYEPSPFGLPGREARRGPRVRTAGDDGRPAPHRALGQHERRVLAAVQAARRRGRRDPRAPAQLSAVRSPDAAGRTDGRAVRPRIPRPVDDRHGERRRAR